MKIFIIVRSDAHMVLPIGLFSALCIDGKRLMAVEYNHLKVDTSIVTDIITIPYWIVGSQYNEINKVDISSEDLLFIDSLTLMHLIATDNSGCKKFNQANMHVFEFPENTMHHIEKVVQFMYSRIYGTDTVDIALGKYYIDKYNEKIKAPLLPDVQNMEQYAEVIGCNYNFPEWFKNIKIFAPEYKTEYRLGDIAKKYQDGESSIGSKVSSPQLGHFLLEKDESYEKISDVIAKKVTELCKEYNIPIASDTFTVHCRLGDRIVIDEDELPLFYKTMKSEMEKREIKKAKIVTGFHSAWLLSTKIALTPEEYLLKNYSFIKSHVNYLESLGIETEVLSNRDVDYDFCLLCSGICIIGSVSGYARFAKCISEELHK